ncbi:MAG: hypothetical protein LQ345_003098 [Seirophora villosa]|nr:MAG: hypothetical protein LQ345_003098 [Seirophora villosa]
MHLLPLLPLPFLLTTLTTLTTAQSLTDIPPCAQTSALESLTSTNCQINDFPCICRNEAFLASLLPVVREACSPDELAQVTAIAQNLCRENGVTLDIPTTTTSAGEEQQPTTTMMTGGGGGGMATGTGGAGTNNNGTVGSTGMPSPTQVVQEPGSGAGVVGASLGAVLLLGGGAVAVGGFLL